MSKRLDLYLFENGFVKSRNVAKTIILNGDITIDGKVCTKPSYMVEDDDAVEITGEMPKYVGRGGLKLEKALLEFNIDLKDKYCIDIGASTGGFTDCMLQNGAEKVFAVDVGINQLADSLRKDERVVCMEKTDARALEKSDFDCDISFAAADVSFISISLILPSMRNLLENNGNAVVLIKPQFEAGKSNIGKNGIVKDRKVHAQVIEKCIEYAETADFHVCGIIPSPIKGTSGNIEYLMHLKCSFDRKFVFDSKTIVKMAFEAD